jgi:hypothetical protein
MDADRGVPLRDFFCGLAEHAFEVRLGVADPPLVDYLAELLARFVRTDAVYSYRNLAGRRLEEVADLLSEAEARIGEARRDIHRHIGDFTLFWTGVYPEALPRMRGSDRKDQFIDYCAQGKRAYYIASTICDEQQDRQSAVFKRLSHEFEMCVHGLGEVRREWERRERGGSWPMLWIA